MSNDKKPIIRSKGKNCTEELLSKLCDKVFLKLWTYPNPYKKKGEELCDVLVIFENHIFIFSVKEILFNKEKETEISWSRWKRKAIDSSIKQVDGAERWIKSHPNEVFSDAKCENKIPININLDNCRIHRIIVAHGAKQACKEFSDENVAGSLAISYSDRKSSSEVEGSDFPFFVNLPRNRVYHVFDSFNLDIILGELDTICDLLRYLEAKEAAAKKYDSISYCGEEDLLTHYLCNFDKKKKRHYIGTKKKNMNGIHIGEGDWHDFALSKTYIRTKKANEISYFWDQLLQQNFQNAQDIGDNDIYNGPSALREMAKEPRFVRRDRSESILNSMKRVPDFCEGMGRHVSSYPSYYPDRRYVFLQIIPSPTMDYETKYHLSRQKMLEIACGVEKIKRPELKKVIGIAIDAPKHAKDNSEDFGSPDFGLLDCSNWSKEKENYYKEENQELKFFETKALQKHVQRSYEFLPDKKKSSIKRRVKIGRNDPCPCGSNKKYKRCCSKNNSLNISKPLLDYSAG